MDVESRVESRSGYLDLEVAAGAMKLVRDIMLVKPGESLVITSDTGSDDRVVAAVARAAYSIGGQPVVVSWAMPPTVSMEPPAAVAGAIKGADAWIEFGVGYIMHSEAFRQAIAAGARYINLTGMDVPMLVNCISKVDFEGALRLAEELKTLVANSREMHVSSAAGTDLRATMEPSRPVLVRGKRAEEPGETIMLSGQLSWDPIEESINGVIVFDGTVWPPNGLELVRNPIRCTVEQGVMKEISGGQEAEILRRWLASHDDPNMYRLAHISLGFNPGVPVPTGRIVEDERTFGGIEFGFGAKGAWLGGQSWTAKAHTDGCVLSPTIEFDGELLEENGRYLHPKVVEACRAMRLPGY